MPRVNVFSTPAHRPNERRRLLAVHLLLRRRRRRAAETRCSLSSSASPPIPTRTPRPTHPPTGVPRILQLRGIHRGVSGIVPATGLRTRLPGSPETSPGMESVGGGHEVPQKPKQKCEIMYDFQRFPVKKIASNDHRSRRWTVFMCKHTLKKIPKIKWGGGLNPPNHSLWVRHWADLPWATPRPPARRYQ